MSPAVYHIYKRVLAGGWAKLTLAKYDRYLIETNSENGINNAVFLEPIEGINRDDTNGNG